MRVQVLRIVAVGLLAVLGEGRVAAAEEPLARLWIHAELKGHKRKVTHLMFSPDGKILASGAGDTVHLWDVAKGKIIHVLPKTGAGVSFSHDGKTLASCGDRRIRLWDVASGKLMAILRADHAVYSAVFSGDGKTLTAVEKGGMTVWDMEKKEEVRWWKAPRWLSPVTAYSASKRPALAVCHNIDRDRYQPFSLIDALTGEQILDCGGHMHASWPFAVDRDEKMIASTGRDPYVRLWNRATGDHIAAFKHPGTVICLALSPHAKIVAVGSASYPTDLIAGIAGIRLYEVPSGELLATEQEHGIYRLAFSPDGRMLASCATETVKLWTVPAAWRKDKK